MRIIVKYSYYVKYQIEKILFILISKEVRFMDIKVLLGKRVREYRQKYGMTQFQLAEKLGIDDKHLSRIELGKNMPQATVISKLAEVFQIEPKTLFEFSHLAPASELRQGLAKMIETLSDEQIILTYKYVKTFVI